jgi:hypothetical protein
LWLKIICSEELLGLLGIPEEPRNISIERSITILGSTTHGQKVYSHPVADTINPD